MMAGKIALRPSYWASVSGGKDSLRYMIEKMKETEQIRSVELGRPFSVTSSKPQYNAEYLEKVITEKWIPKLEEIERRNNLGSWNKIEFFEQESFEI